MARTFILTKEQMNEISRRLIKEDVHVPGPQNPSMKSANKPFCISPEKVMIVKKFLDGGFKKGKFENIGSNGYPQTIRFVGMTDSQGNVLKNLLMDEMVDLLIDKYQKMFSDHIERELFMRQVLNDWYDNKIGVFGTLSVNSLR